MHLPKEIKPIGLIHPNRKKMSSKECLKKHLKQKKEERQIKKRLSKKKIFIVKKRDMK